MNEQQKLLHLLAETVKQKLSAFNFYRIVINDLEASYNFYGKSYHPHINQILTKKIK